MRNPRVLLYVALVLAVFNLLHKADAAQRLPLVHADFPMCINVDPGPIVSQKPAAPYARQKDVA
jgi:hypothetical protein